MYRAVHVLCSGEWIDILIARLSILPFDTFEEKETGFSAYMPEDQFDEKQVCGILDEYTNEVESFEFQIVEKENWNAEWEKNYQPVNIDGRVVVRADFHDNMPDFEHQIVIHPKMSFGTGHHATTYLMIKLQLGIDFESKAVADFGTGTGVLGIMSMKLGAKSVLVTDVDDWCIENSKDNFELNQISAIDYLLGPIKELQIDTIFDIIIANINKNVLLDEMVEYSRHLVSDGYLLLSGFYTKDISEVVRFAEKLGFSLEKNENKDDWAALLFKKLR